VVFPVLHGTFGEDGTIQGCSSWPALPTWVRRARFFAGMDKDVMKRLFKEAGLPIVKHVTVLRAEWEKQPRKAVAAIETRSSIQFCEAGQSGLVGRHLQATTLACGRRCRARPLQLARNGLAGRPRLLDDQLTASLQPE